MFQMIEQIEAEEQNQMIRQLAGEEDPTNWASIITRWLQEYALDQPTHLLQLHHELRMSFIEIWLGLLLGEFELEQIGNFYSSDILVKCKLKK